MTKKKVASFDVSTGEVGKRDEWLHETWQREHAAMNNTMKTRDLKAHLYFRVYLPNEWLTEISIQKDIQEKIFEFIEEVQSKLSFQMSWTVGYHARYAATFLWYEGESAFDKPGNIMIQVEPNNSYIWHDESGGAGEVLKKWFRLQFDLPNSPVEWAMFWIPDVARQTENFEDWGNSPPKEMYYPFGYHDRDEDDSMGS